jgi:hypothetical protein
MKVWFYNSVFPACVLSSGLTSLSALGGLFWHFRLFLLPEVVLVTLSENYMWNFLEVGEVNEIDGNCTMENFSTWPYIRNRISEISFISVLRDKLIKLEKGIDLICFPKHVRKTSDLYKTYIFAVVKRDIISREKHINTWVSTYLPIIYQQIINNFIIYQFDLSFLFL